MNGHGPERLPSGRHNLSRSFVIESQRDRLLDSMAEACAEKRYPEVSVADVVRRARVSRSTFYEIFTDKLDCYLAAYDAILGRYIGQLVGICQDSDAAWADQLELGIERSLSFFAGEPAFARMCIVDLYSAGPPALARYHSALRFIAAFIDTARRRVPGAEEVPAEVAGMMAGGAAVVVRGEIVDGRTGTLLSVGPDILHVILAQYMDLDEAMTRSAKFRERLNAA